MTQTLTHPLPTSSDIENWTVALSEEAVVHEVSQAELAPAVELLAMRMVEGVQKSLKILNLNSIVVGDWRYKVLNDVSWPVSRHGYHWSSHFAPTVPVLAVCLADEEYPIWRALFDPRQECLIKGKLWQPDGNIFYGEFVHMFGGRRVDQATAQTKTHFALNAEKLLERISQLISAQHQATVAGVVAAERLALQLG